MSNNAPSLPPLSPPPPAKKKFCITIVFGRLQYPGEIEYNYYAKFSFFGGGGGAKRGALWSMRKW